MVETVSVAIIEEIVAVAEELVTGARDSVELDTEAVCEIPELVLGEIVVARPEVEEDPVDVVVKQYGRVVLWVDTQPQVGNVRLLLEVEQV